MARQPPRSCIRLTVMVGNRRSFDSTDVEALQPLSHQARSGVMRDERASASRDAEGDERMCVGSPPVVHDLPCPLARCRVRGRG